MSVGFGSDEAGLNPAHPLHQHWTSPLGQGRLPRPTPTGPWEVRRTEVYRTQHALCCLRLTHSLSVHCDQTPVELTGPGRDLGGRGRSERPCVHLSTRR